jgi:hypothetical protein
MAPLHVAIKRLKQKGDYTMHSYTCPHCGTDYFDEATNCTAEDCPGNVPARQKKKLVITEQTATRIILAAYHTGKQWEIDVRVDFDEVGGIVADIARDGIHCTSAEFGWHEKHQNEPQD